ncbi:MAG: flavodoxin [Synergistaceae bacterium]|nr:flavodoxin [Synergistaceae bacterium]
MNKKLVTYFSASGATAKLAEKLANAVGADLYEIKPEKAYAPEDLDWTNAKSRSSMEMNDKTFRPAVKGKVDNIGEYNVIYVGFPIWWYVAPTIVNTFLESHDLENKKIVLFATSGGSGMGNTVAELKDSCNGKIIDAKRFSQSASEKELKDWSKKLEA